MGTQISLERYDAQIIGREFQFSGKMEPVGPLMDYFNSENRSTFPLFDVTVYPVASRGALKAITRPEITVSGSEMGLIYFSDPGFRERVQLLKNFDSVIAYTPYAVVRGNVHRGVETRLRDLFDLMSGSFLAMTDASTFPTTELPCKFPQQAELLIVNRFYVNLYHLA